MQRAERKRKVYTYANEEGRHGGQDGEDEDERHDLGRARGVGAEHVVDLGLLPVAQGPLVGDGRRVGVPRQLDLEQGLAEAVGRRPEARQHDRRLERRTAGGELHGEVAVFLCRW